MLRVAVLASGVGSNLQALLDRIASGHVHAAVTLVVSDKPEAGALDRARRARVPAVIALPKLDGEKRADYDQRLLDVLSMERPDLVVLAGYMRIVGPVVTKAFAGRIVNIHPSLLPAFQGLHAVRQALEAGVERAGCTTHLVTDDLDGGPILLQASIHVKAGESEVDLRRRILRLEHVLLPRTVELFAARQVIVTKQQTSITPGPSWLERPELDLMSGAWFSPGF